MLTRITNYTLEDVQNGIQYLLDKASSSPEVRMLAIEIVADKQDRIAAIYDFVRTTVKYVPDPVADGGIELFISPVRMVKDYRVGMVLGGDCDDMALLTTALCRSIGIQSNVVLIDSVGKGFDHAYCQAHSDKLGMINVDSSAPVPLGWAIQYQQKVVV